MNIQIYEPAFLYEGHSYHTPDGTELLSVTQVCKAGLGLYIHKRSGPAAQKGTLVHQTLELYDKNDLVMETLDPILVKYLEQYKLALEENKITVIQNETRRYHPELLFAGTIDKIVKINGEYALIDIKTGKHEAWHMIQLGAYGKLLESEVDIKKYYCLYLTEDSHELVEVDGKEGFSYFLALYASTKIRIKLGYV